MKRYIPKIGLRTFKTALAVIISMFLASLFGELTIFVPLSAIAVMSKTFSEGLQECRVQAVGILIGGILGCLTAMILPNPPILFMGIGVIVIIFLCTSLKVAFSCGLSTAIFLVACLSEPELVFINTMTRLIHTAIGLVTGLIINYAIVPYDNSKKIYDLLQQLLDPVPSFLESMLCFGLYPDLSVLNELMHQLENELSIYRRQRFHKKELHEQEYSYLCGCVRLAVRVKRELETLLALDQTGIPAAENIERLRQLNMDLPAIFPGTEDPKIATVTNYHLSKLLDARGHLVELLEER